MAERLFISYATEDAARVREYLRDLAAEGVDVWIDQNDIHPSDDLIRRINDGIAASKYALLFFSAQYAAKPYTTAEHEAIVAAAVVNRDRKVFVVRLDDAPLPPLLAGKLYFKGGMSPGEVARRIAAVIRQQDGAAGGASSAIPSARATPRIVRVAELSDVSVESLAELLLEGGLGRYALSPAKLPPFIEGYVHGVGRARIYVRASALTRSRFQDFESVVEINKTHGKFLHYLQEELAEGGLGVFKPAYRIKIEKRTENIAGTRGQLREFLEWFVERIENLD
jgi:hypothetical protein